jgi:hypothetical protein
MDAPFIDPRTGPDPASARRTARIANDWDALQGLQQLCRAGRTYGVERWIAEGRPLQVPAFERRRRARRSQSALEIALQAGNYALVLLLLVNGYDANQEGESPLDQALSDRRWDLVDLLLEWGADPQDVDLETLFGTYQTSLFERFAAFGVDLTANHELASCLAHHTSNKPLFGFARRHRARDARIQLELNIALGHHAETGNEKGVMLCLWAGADPHTPAPSLRYDVRGASDDGDDDDEYVGVSAVWQACCSGHHEVLARLGVDSERDDIDSLYCVARDSATIGVLMRVAPPRRPGVVISALIQDVSWRSSSTWGDFGHRHYETVRALESLFESGVRWHAAEGDEAAAVRATLIKLRDDPFIEILKLLTAKDYCSPDLLTEIARTPAMRRRMKEVGFIPSDADASKRSRRDPPTRWREVISKCGIELPKPRAIEPVLPREVRIGFRRPGTREMRISREGLYDRVWSAPVEQLARSWGVSGRGLAKACVRLQVPVPPRGYWARLSAGQRPRRPRLPALKAGKLEAIVLWQEAE